MKTISIDHFLYMDHRSFINYVPPHISQKNRPPPPPNAHTMRTDPEKKTNRPRACAECSAMTHICIMKDHEYS